MFLNACVLFVNCCVVVECGVMACGVVYVGVIYMFALNEQVQRNHNQFAGCDVVNSCYLLV